MLAALFRWYIYAVVLTVNNESLGFGIVSKAVFQCKVSADWSGIEAHAHKIHHPPSIVYVPGDMTLRFPIKALSGRIKVAIGTDNGRIACLSCEIPSIFDLPFQFHAITTNPNFKSGVFYYRRAAAGVYQQYRVCGFASIVLARSFGRIVNIDMRGSEPRSLFTFHVFNNFIRLFRCFALDCQLLPHSLQLTAVDCQLKPSPDSQHHRGNCGDTRGLKHSCAIKKISNNNQYHANNDGTDGIASKNTAHKIKCAAASIYLCFVAWLAIRLGQKRLEKPNWSEPEILAQILFYWLFATICFVGVFSILGGHSTF